MKNKICPRCSKEFKAASNRQKYCTITCGLTPKMVQRVNSKDKSGWEIACRKCNAKFVSPSPNQQYCSVACGHIPYVLDEDTRKAIRDAKKSNKCLDCKKNIYKTATRCGSCAVRAQKKSEREILKKAENPLPSYTFTIYLVIFACTLYSIIHHIIEKIFDTFYH